MKPRVGEGTIVHPQASLRALCLDPTRLPLERGARRMVRVALSATLATLDAADGHPHASLVAMATDVTGAPLLLLSSLAVHTRNLAADARASLLVASLAPGIDPLTQPRLTLIGRLQRADDETARARFLARHRDAEAYASFGDFSFWRMQLIRAHLIRGFGRIDSLPGAALTLEAVDAGPMDTTLVGRVIAGAEPINAAETWSITGVDGEGIDLRGAHGADRLELPGVDEGPRRAEALAELSRTAAAPPEPSSLTTVVHDPGVATVRRHRALDY